MGRVEWPLSSQGCRDIKGLPREPKFPPQGMYYLHLRDRVLRVKLVLLRKKKSCII